MRRLAPLHLPAEEEPTGRCLLKDGTVAVVRPAQPGDLPLMERFFHGLSAESLYQRFFRTGEPPRRVIAPLCDSTDPDRALTLVATRIADGAVQFVGAATYVRISAGVAEVAFAVGDTYHGKGIATALLERLLVTGARRGFRTFTATTLAVNFAMLDVFRRSGFQASATSADDIVEITLAVSPTAEGVSAAEERERMATTTSIAPFLEPRGIAVVGASRDTSSIGRRVLDALLTAKTSAAVYPIHHTAPEVAGLRAYRSVRDVGQPIDVAIVAVPRGSVLGVVDDCAAAGVRAIVMITAGFAEADDDGKDLQRQLVEKVRGYGMRLVGPNCLGLVTTDPRFSVNASFSPVFPPAGGFALSSQSGALGIVILSLAASRHVGISSFVSVGNKADVSGNDLLQYWEGDSRTSVIGLYLESFGNPRRFARIARRVSRTKPIVVVKSGRTAAGLRAASSHTAAMATRDVAVDALLRQTGAIRAETIDEMFDIAACLTAQPPPRGRRIAIVTNAGGPGILAADACETAGLEVVRPSAGLAQRIAELLPGVPHPGNPIDMIASARPESYESVVRVLVESGEIDALMVLYTPVDLTSAERVHAAIGVGVASARQAGARDITVVACLMAESGFQLSAGGEQIPVYAFPENAARALGKAAAYAGWRAVPEGRTWTYDDLAPDRARAVAAAAIAARGADWLSNEETRVLLDAFGLHPTLTVLARSAEEAAAAAVRLGFPVVAKMSAPGLVHKTEAGGVKSHLSNEGDVARAFEDLGRAARQHGLAFDGVFIQPMSQGGIETMIGMVRDPSFGPLVGFGLGGTEVEILGDVQFGLAPLSDRDIVQLIERGRAGRLLAGYRGRPPGDVEALADLLSRVSVLADTVPEIVELDFNPVMVLPRGRGCDLVDVRIKVGPPASAGF